MISKQDLDAIRERNIACAAIWFTCPESDRGHCYRDRRALLAEIEQLRRHWRPSQE